LSILKIIETVHFLNAVHEYIENTKKGNNRHRTSQTTVKECVWNLNLKIIIDHILVVCNTK